MISGTYINRIATFLLVLVITASSVNADTNSQYLQGEETFNEGNYQLAIEILTPLAEQGHSKAQLLLGAMYEQGIGTQKDNRIAEHWYKKSALRDNADAQFLLGMLYINSQPNDEVFNAMYWIKKAADNGDGSAKQLIDKAAKNGWFQSASATNPNI